MDNKYFVRKDGDYIESSKQSSGELHLLAIGIGEKFDLRIERIEILGYAAVFHDLGKVNISEELLNKSGKLTDEEYELIKQHPADGAAMVSETYYEYLSDIILQHHERIDGKGYPNGLKGEDILIEAKIISVADTYDAITSDRPYSKGRSSNAAIEELRKYSGTQFDGEVVEKFIEYLNEQLYIE